MDKKEFIPVISIFSGILFWQTFSMSFPPPTSSYIPPPTSVAFAFVDLVITGDIFGNTLWNHCIASLIRVFIGTFFAILIAVPFGFLIGLSDRIDRFFSPIVEAIRPIPPIAWIPFSIVLFGIGLSSHAFIIWLGVFFPVLSNTYAGVRRTSKVLIEVAKSLGATQFEIIGKIFLPSTLPDFFVGLRVGIGVGWMCVIASEMIGLREPLGLGFLVLFMAEIGKFPQMIAAMITIGIIGIGINYLLSQIESRWFRWQEKIV